MIRKIGCAVCILLSLLWVYIVGISTLFAFGFYSEYHGIQFLDSRKVCPAFAVPRRDAVPLYLAATGKPAWHSLSSIQKFVLPPPDAKWAYQCDSPVSILNYTVKRSDISFAFADVFDYLKKQHLKLDDIGQCTIGDLNNDGRTEAFIAFITSTPGGFFPGVSTYAYSWYGERGETIVPYLVITCETYPIKPYHLPDGRYCFANKPLIWHRQAICWNNDNYALKRQSLDNERGEIARKFYRAIFTSGTMIYGLLLVPLLLFLFLPGLRSPITNKRKIFLSLIALTLVLAVLASFTGFCHWHGYNDIIGLALGEMLLPLLTVAVLYCYYIKRIWELKRGSDILY